MKKFLIIITKILINIFLLFCLFFVARTFTNWLLFFLIFLILILFNINQLHLYGNKVVKIKFKVFILLFLVLLCFVYLYVPKKRTFCVATDPIECFDVECIGLPFVIPFGGGGCFGNNLNMPKNLPY